MDKLPSGRQIGVGCLLIASVVWGCSFPIGKSAMLAVDAYFLTVIHYVIAAAVLMASLLFIEGGKSLRCEGRAPLIGLLGASASAGASC